MISDLTATREDIACGRTSAKERLEAALEAAAGDANRCTFIRRFDAMAGAAARGIDAEFAAGAPLPPLAGLAVSIKDLFDVRGQVTTAGSKLLVDAAPAAEDSAAVARLRRAGAALIGHTNMSEFAFSGVGINPHYGTPANAATARLDPVARIPGGSTSGGAVSVATGAAWAALGSDTGGSIRIPAALHGLVGFKNTARLTSTAGAVPLSTTLDTACAITLSVRDAALLHAVLCAGAKAVRERPVNRLRLAVPVTTMLDTMQPQVATAFDRAMSALRQAGAVIDEIALPEIASVAGIQATGGFAAAESWAWHRHRMKGREADYDPRVAARILRGQQMAAADYIDLLHAREAWIARMDASIAGYDALLSPTVPIVAPPVASVDASDDAFFATNALLLRNPSVVNMLDGCALSLPCHHVGDWPVGLMVWGPALADDRILAVSLAIESALAVGRA